MKTRNAGETVELETLEKIDGRWVHVTWRIVADGWGGFSERKAIAIRS